MLSLYGGAYKIYSFDWLRRLLAAICVVNVYDRFMSTGGFITDSIGVVTDLIK